MAVFHRARQDHRSNKHHERVKQKPEAIGPGEIHRQAAD